MAGSIDCDVLIVGAGPTGLALAAELRRLGASPMVVERHAAGANTSRAAVIHARTLEVLEPLGVTETLVGDGLKMREFWVQERDRILLSVDFGGLPTAYPFALMLPQDRTEAILLARLEALGGSVTRGATFEGFEADGEGVRARIATTDGVRTVTARWLVGCDGMHSKVREAAAIGFKGAAYAQTFVLADVRMDWPAGRQAVGLFLAPEGLMVIAPLPGDHFRIVATVDDGPESPSVAFVQQLLDSRGPGRDLGTVREAVWGSRFQVHHRLADSPRKGRVLLCGDAAHVHSPAGGQGMNTGIQDGVSLAAALVAGDETGLDAWAARRRAIARQVVLMTDQMTRMAMIKSKVGQGLRNWIVSTLLRVPALRRRVVRTLAELDY